MQYLFENQNIWTLISAVISVLVTLYIFKAAPRYDLVRERYEKLIFPLFNNVESNLFKVPTPEILNPLLNIIENNKLLSGGQLNQLLYFCSVNPSQENYNNLCHCISTEYDKSCARLGLKRRSMKYRIIRNQYQTKLGLIMYIIFSLVFFACMLFVFFTILGGLNVLLTTIGL